MNRHIIFFIDDDSRERKACADVLAEIFGPVGIDVCAPEPPAELTAYSELAAGGATAGFILDQRLGTSGGLKYSGIDVAQYLRATHPKIPIVILTNYGDDDFGDGTWSVECVAKKIAILKDPASPRAIEFRERMLRHINVFSDIASDRTQRFHDLLVKSLRESLADGEREELRLLDTERTIVQQALDLHDIAALELAIAELRTKLKLEARLFDEH